MLHVSRVNRHGRRSHTLYAPTNLHFDGLRVTRHAPDKVPRFGVIDVVTTCGRRLSQWPKYKPASQMWRATLNLCQTCNDQIKTAFPYMAVRFRNSRSGFAHCLAAHFAAYTSKTLDILPNTSQSVLGDGMSRRFTLN